MAEDEVLVELRAVLAVEVDVEQLPVPQRLGDGVDEVEVRHLLVADLGVEPDHVGVLERRDERQGVADGRQEDVAAGLVGLGLEREADAVAPVLHVAGEEVDRLAVAVERRPDVLGHVDLGALAAAPEHVGLGTELGGQVEVAHHLADGEAAHLAVVGGERSLLEHRVGEEVGRHHRHDHPGVVERGPEPLEVLRPQLVVAAERHHVVVVERHAIGAQLGQPVHRLDRVERRAGRVAEGVAGLPPDGPQAKGELVLGTRAQGIGHGGNLLL